LNHPAIADGQGPPDWFDDDDEDNDIVVVDILNDDIVHDDVVNDDDVNDDDAEEDAVNDSEDSADENSDENEDTLSDENEDSDKNEDPEEYYEQLERDFPWLQRQRIRTERAELSADRIETTVILEEEKDKTEKIWEDVRKMKLELERLRESRLGN